VRIIGGRDYYDSGMAWGRDDAVLFLRNGNRTLSDREAQDLLHLPMRNLAFRLIGAQGGFTGRPSLAHRGDPVQAASLGRLNHVAEFARVVLCGVLHDGMRITAKERFGSPTPIDQRWIWTASAYRSYAGDHGLTYDEGKPSSSKNWIRRGGADVYADVPELPLDDWFAPVRLEGASRDAILDHRITIVSCDSTVTAVRGPDGVARPWLIDQPTLGSMEFAKAVDPYTAFQEIAMWKSGVLGSDGARMVEITDDRIKAEKHGFHHPTSFRRAKESLR
jgi:hypothetical protein